MLHYYQNAIDTILSAIGTIPAIALVIFPLTFLTFFFVSLVDSSTTLKEGLKSFFYVAAPVNIALLLIVALLVITGTVSNVYVPDDPANSYETSVREITVTHGFDGNNPDKETVTTAVVLADGTVLTKANAHSGLDTLEIGDDITLHEYDTKERHLFTPATDGTIYTFDITRPHPIGAPSGHLTQK